MGRFCGECGKPLEEGSKFCQFCGTPVVEETAASAKPAPQQPVQPPVQQPVQPQMQPPVQQPVQPQMQQPMQPQMQQRMMPPRPAMQNPLPNQPAHSFENEDFKQKFLCFDGRLNRQRYFLRSLCLALIYGLFYGIAAATKSEGLTILIGILYIPVAVCAISLGIRRLHDLDKSGWLWLLCLIPIVGFGMGIYMLFFKGTDGPNRYGEDPLNSYFQQN